MGNNVKQSFVTEFKKLHCGAFGDNVLNVCLDVLLVPASKIKKKQIKKKTLTFHNQCKLSAGAEFAPEMLPVKQWFCFDVLR